MRFTIRKKLMLLTIILGLALAVASGVISSSIYAASMRKNIEESCLEAAVNSCEVTDGYKAEFVQKYKEKLLPIYLENREDLEQIEVARQFVLEVALVGQGRGRVVPCYVKQLDILVRTAQSQEGLIIRQCKAGTERTVDHKRAVREGRLQMRSKRAVTIPAVETERGSAVVVIACRAVLAYPNALRAAPNVTVGVSLAFEIHLS